MTVASVLIALAAICFALVALGIGGAIPLLPVGLCFFALGHIPWRQ
jgi:hypothetical protein